MLVVEPLLFSACFVHCISFENYAILRFTNQTLKRGDYTEMTARLKCLTIILLYLFSGFILYSLTYEHSLFFLLYRLIYGILFFVILYDIYRFLSKKQK